jgi:hypothetical protein
MNHIDYISLLGQYYGEIALVKTLESLAMKKPPRMPRGESDTIVVLPKLGLEFTFTDERALDWQSRTYPDGALVLTNVFFHAKETDQHSAYAGDLPADLSFNFNTTELTSRLGKPDASDEDGTLMRFDRPQYSISVETDESGNIMIVGAQMASKATSQ